LKEEDGMNNFAQSGPSRVIVGVDTHLDLHVAVAIDGVGRRLGELVIATTPLGYRKLLSWAELLGTVEVFGIEGTGSYGAGARSEQA
jgi:transposase